MIIRFTNDYKDYGIVPKIICLVEVAFGLSCPCPIQGKVCSFLLLRFFGVGINVYFYIRKEEK